MEMTGKSDCRVDLYAATADAADYVARYRDGERFLALCRECPNFGRSWACPPFDTDIDAALKPFATVTIHAVKIMPVTPGLPLDSAKDLLRFHREEFERRLLKIERDKGGRVFTFAGECLYCPAGTCTRSCGLPCRHPDMVRPSLEAYGFDVGLTVRDYLGLDLLWGKDNRLPDYLLLVGAHFS